MFATAPVYFNMTAPPPSTDIPVVLAPTPYRRYERERDRDRNKGRNERGRHSRSGFEKLLQEEVEKTPGQIGCLFEAKA